MKTAIHQLAEIEIRDTAKFLEIEQAGLGPKFLIETKQVLASLELNPFQFGPAPGTIHKQQVRVAIYPKFKFTMVFHVVVEHDLVLVLSVRHGHRRPGGWIPRLEDFRPGGDDLR